MKQISHHQERYNKVTRVLGNPLFQLVFPLITNILDCFRKEETMDAQNLQIQQTDVDKLKHKYIKRYALLGSLVGTGFGVALVSPGGLTYALSKIGIINKDFPVDKLSDLFPHQDRLDDAKKIIICFIVIAAITVFFKSAATALGVRAMNKEMKMEMEEGEEEEEEDSLEKPFLGKNNLDNLEMPNPVVTGTLYGFFGDSSSDVTAFYRWVRAKCNCYNTNDDTDSPVISVSSYLDRDEDELRKNGMYFE